MMTVSETISVPPQQDRQLLVDILASREDRQRRQQQWLSELATTLISLTLVTPGQEKDSRSYRKVFAYALSAIEDLASTNQWRIIKREEFYKHTGCEALFAVDAAPLDVKAATFLLEDSHPYGRLWDIDVLSAEGDILSREQLGSGPRKCLVCQEPARDCARSARHPIAEVLSAVDAIMESMP